MSILSRLFGGRGKPRSRGRTLGIVLVAFGGVLVSGTVAYYGLSLSAYAWFEGRTGSTVAAPIDKELPQGWQVVQPAAPAPSTSPTTPRVSYLAAYSGPSVELYPAVTPTSGSAASPAAASAAPAAQPVLEYVNWANLPTTLGQAPPARRIQIPAIGVDSKVVEVGTVVKDGIFQWETAKWAVGWHEGTANPGELGNTVMSGHISSPLLREGEVFKRLPEITKLVDTGQVVDIIVWTEEARYLYRVTSWELVKPEAFDVFANTKEPTVTLITCYPDFAYWDRLIIRSRLVAKAPLDGKP